jgi:hypothetical protein
MFDSGFGKCSCRSQLVRRQFDQTGSGDYGHATDLRELRPLLGKSHEFGVDRWYQEADLVLLDDLEETMRIGRVRRPRHSEGTITNLVGGSQTVNVGRVYRSAQRTCCSLERRSESGSATGAG